MIHHHNFADQPVFDFIIIEAKSLGWKIKWDKDKKKEALGMIIKLGDRSKKLKRNASKRERMRFLRIKKEFEVQGWNIIQNFINGKLSREKAEKQLRKLFRKKYQEAFTSGWRSSGIAEWVSLSEEDWQWLESSLQEEFTYLSNFLDDIEKGYQKMPYKKRWSMYAETLEHVFLTGKLSVIPEEYVIDWIITEAEHCKGCIYLKKHSPYTVFTLPTVPKAGLTPCLSNCKCKLRVRQPKSQIEYKAAKNKQKRSLLLDLKKIKDGVK